jgi:hypothetical protein
MPVHLDEEHFVLRQIKETGNMEVHHPHHPYLHHHRVKCKELAQLLTYLS